jgi:uncharacterized repeat protein (TIGR01451 family)
LQINNCFPLQTSVQSATKSVCNTLNNEIAYIIEIRNSGSGNAAGVLLDFVLPMGINFVSKCILFSWSCRTWSTNPIQDQQNNPLGSFILKDRNI